MPLFVRSLGTHTLDLSQQKTVEDVKSFINEREGLPADQMAVFFEGQPLEDACELVNFKNEATINVELRMLGGKVHGSLARAGKVRGQTPKVEKQEKKKSKTGRAKRRMQYNRRFVNVVAGFGRKKGPNARS
ncbi:hypothetical protein EGW08_019458 [Elysia chlorotica]|uniref:Ubiquitin-like domain-containing protein n=1 Tax=Elysia chlorotica TaxID=188477 RepID=A0A3S1B1L9_ELYCH|nr:hypothetical protein EGW08_019458 [Elysia chlorotica]